MPDIKSPIFRLGNILSLFPGRLSVIASSLMVVDLLAYHHYFVPPYTDAAVGQYVITVSMLLSVAFLGAQLYRNWHAKRSELLQSENYIVLVILALYAGAGIGFSEWFVYRLSPSSFAIDDQLKSEIKSRSTANIQNDIADALGQEAVCSEIVQSLRLHQSKTDTGDLALVDASVAPAYETSPYGFLNVGLKNITIQSTSRIDGPPSNRTHHEISVNAPGVTFTLEVTSSPIEDPAAYDVPSTTEYNDSSLIDLMSAHGGDEKQRAVDDQKELKQNVTVSPLMFVYQSTIGILGSDIGYFKPANDVTRLAEWGVALFKYIFFGIFLSLLSERWRPRTTD